MKKSVGTHWTNGMVQRAVREETLSYLSVTSQPHCLWLQSAAGCPVIHLQGKQRICSVPSAFEKHSTQTFCDQQSFKFQFKYITSKGCTFFPPIYAHSVILGYTIKAEVDRCNIMQWAWELNPPEWKLVFPFYFNKIRFFPFVFCIIQTS